MKFNLIIDNTPVDLFNDESITFSRKVKDLTDLSTAWTDFTQAFTIPSSPKNDGVFANWFSENAVFDGWNPNLGLDAQILLHGLPVFEGRVELKGTKFLEGLPSSYDIIFYGKVKRILDLWGESLMNQIDLSAYEHIANNANVTGSWNQTLLSGDVLYPIADYYKGWRYSKLSGINNNIRNSRGVEIDDVRPSIRFSALFQKAFGNIGYSVTGSFLSRPDIEDLYVLGMQNAGALYDRTTQQPFFTATRNLGLTFTAKTIGIASNVKLDFTTASYNPSGAFDLSTDEYTVTRKGNYGFELTIDDLNIPFVSGLNNSITMFFCVNGNPMQSQYFNSSYTGSQTYYFNSSLNIGDKVTIQYASYGTNSCSFILFACSSAPYGLKNTIVNMADTMPQIKIKDFINGTLQAFNLIAVPVSDSEIEIHNIYDWYELGTLKDYTNYIDIKEITHEKIPVPKDLTFTHKESEILANNYYRKLANREFGSITYAPNVDFPIDELKVETIFNVLAPSFMDEVNGSGVKVRTTEINMPVFLDSDGKPVKQDLTLFYYGGKQTVTDTYYFDGVLQTVFPLMTCFSAYPTTKTSYSTAFGIEASFSGDAPLETMYMMYWHKYVSRMYSNRSRVVKMKAILPVLEWLKMKLNDTIAISGNYYKIQSIQYDMLSEVANLELITYPDVNFLTLDSDGDTIDYGDPVSNSNGETYIKSYPVASGILNSYNSNGVNLANTMQDVSYNQNSVSDLLFQVENIQQTLQFNQWTLYNSTPQVLTTSDTVWIPIPQSTAEQIGYVGNLSYDLAQCSFTALEGGQYKFIGMVAFQQSGSRKLEYTIFINDVPSTAYACTDSNYHSIQIDCILTLGINDVVSLKYKNVTSGSHSINVLKTNFAILKK
jgi:hypothetical protein